MKKITLPSTIFLLLASGCVSNQQEVKPLAVTTNTVTVEKPVEVARKPPDYLMTPISDVLPVWQAPDNKTSSSCLTVDGETQLKLLIHDYVARESAWRAWATQ